jgi:cell division protein ZapA
MGRVTVTLNNRTYRLACGDGEEVRLQALAAHLKVKVDDLAAQFGQVGEERLLLMAALLVTDELFDARERAENADTVDQPETGAADVAAVPDPVVPAAGNSAATSSAMVVAPEASPKLSAKKLGSPNAGARLRKPPRTT